MKFNILAARFRMTALLAVSLLVAPGYFVWSAVPAVAPELVDFKLGIWYRGGTRVPTLLPVWMAEDAGLFKEQGLNVQMERMEQGGANGAPLSVLSSGQLQAMHPGLLPVVLANEQGDDLRLVASSSILMPFALVANVKTPAELKGEKVDIGSPRTERDITVTLALKRLGLTRDEVHIVALEGNAAQRLDEVLSGQVRAVAMSEPDAVVATARHKELTLLVNLLTLRVPWVFDGVVVSRGYLKSHRDEVKQFLKAYVEGAYIALSDEKRAKNLISKNFNTEDSMLVDANYDEFKRSMPLDAEPSRAGVQNVVEAAKAVGIQVGHKDVDDYIAVDVLEELKKEGFLAALQKRYHVGNSRAPAGF
jgi:NitT/TauT family transport system substrate-binding protein